MQHQERESLTFDVCQAEMPTSPAWQGYVRETFLGRQTRMHSHVRPYCRDARQQNRTSMVHNSIEVASADIEEVHQGIHPDLADGVAADGRRMRKR